MAGAFPSDLPLVHVIAKFVLHRFVPDGVVLLCGDDTVDGHSGKNVYGKARHRDAVRSSHSYTAYRHGQKWVVLTLLVYLPYTNRPFALPLLVALYRDEKTNAAEGRRHKTPVQLMCGLLAVLMRWFPDRTFVFAGDGAYGTHEFARFAHRHRRRVGLVSKFVPDANLFAPPPKPGAHRCKSGRPLVKGRALPKPHEVVASKNKGKRLRVRWYGGGWRNVEVISGHGQWYKSGIGLVPVLWVFVRDLDGTDRDDYFFTTNTTLSAKEVIEIYGGRWNIETTFQEMRALGFRDDSRLESANHFADGTVPVLAVHAGGGLLRHTSSVKPSHSSYILGWQTSGNLFGHARQRPALPMDLLDICTSAWRTGCAKTPRCHSGRA